MTPDITLMGKSFKWIASLQNGGSLRRSTTDGATLPHTIKINHTDAVDSATKVACRRSQFRVDVTHLDTGGVSPSPLPCTAYVVFVKGKGMYGPSSATIQLTLNMLIQALSQTAADASALALRDLFGINEEQ